MRKLTELLKPSDYAIIEETYKDYSLDWDKVFEFAYNLDVKNIQYPSSYRRGAIIREIEKGTFIKETKPQRKKIVNLVNLWKDLESIGVRILSKSQCYINTLEQYLVDSGIDPNELYDLNHQIVEYLKEGDTTEKFYKALVGSHFIKKYNIDINQVEEIAEQDWQEWELLTTTNEDDLAYLR